MDLKPDPIRRYVAALADGVLGSGGREIGATVLEVAAPVACHRRDRERRRTSVLTHTGAPVEVSLTTAAGTLPRLRCAIEPGSAFPFFGARLQALHTATETVLARFGRPGPGTDDVRALLAVAFPSVEGVAARTRLVGSVGLVYSASDSQRPCGVKLYLHIRPDDAALGRVVRRWPRFAPLVACPSPAWEPYAVAFDLDLDLDLDLDATEARPRVYLRSRHQLGRDEVAQAADWALSGSGDPLQGLFAEAGAGDRPGRRALFLARSDGDGAEISSTLHISLAGHCWHGDRERFVRSLNRAVEGDERLTEALSDAARTADVAWTPTVVGLGLSAARIDKLNLYASLDDDGGDGEPPMARSSSDRDAS